jgi:crossover junction endodeoxyribonuclease RusA
MRMSERELELHLKRHQKRKNQALEQSKQKNGVKVHEATQKSLEAITEPNTKGEGKVILKCEIPSVPPSVNNYWVGTGRTCKVSDRGRDFHDLVAMTIPQLNTMARLKLDVTFHFPNKQRRDIDNFLKATIDSLVKCGLCVDDEQFDELSVKRGEIIKGGLIKIIVLELQK